MSFMNFVDIMGFRVYNDSLSKIDAVDETIVINTISPNSYGISTKDSLFNTALHDSDYLLLDGVYFGLPEIILNGNLVKKNQAPFVFKFFMDKINKEKGRVFFLGSTEKTLLKISNRIKFEYPDLMHKCYSPPFKKRFSSEENSDILIQIKEFCPDVLFVGMTCPKQEKWVYENKVNIAAKYVISIGAVFDWYAGNEKEISPIWWRLNLAWLIRTIHRPEILRRYPNIGIFFFHFISSLIRIKKF